MQRLRRVYSFVEKIISMTPAELVLFLKKIKENNIILYSTNYFKLFGRKLSCTRLYNK